MFVCPAHGLSEDDHCKLCTYKITKRSTPRSLARQGGFVEYDGDCPIHGITAFGVPSGKCLTCFTASGVIRPTIAKDDTRAMARRMGLHRYVDICPVHGKAYFGVRYGKCLGCFTTDGLTRQPLPNFQVEG